MPTPKRGPRLGGGPAHQRALMTNLASDLFRHGRIRTTESKAKALRPYAEKLITKAKVGDLHNRRQVLSSLRDRDVVAYLFEEVAPRFADRPGGYTRIVKLDPRPGDNARMAIIELVDRGAGESGEEFIEESKSQRSRGLFGRLRRRGGSEPTGAGTPGAAYTSGDEDADAATVEDATDVTADEVAEATDAPEDTSTTEADVQDAIAEVADPDSDADSIAEATGEGAGQEAPPVDAEATAEGSEPGDPSDRSIGVPVDETANDADAGESAGKDAGEK